MAKNYDPEELEESEEMPEEESEGELEEAPEEGEEIPEEEIPEEAEEEKPPEKPPKKAAAAKPPKPPKEIEVTPRGIGPGRERGKSEVLSATSYYEKGNEYYEQGDYDKAIENYSMAIILNPNFLECYFNRALCYYNKKNYNKAIEDYSRAAEIDPENPMIYNNRGDAYYRKQEFDSAIADYDKAISLNKDYLKAHYNRGLAYACLQDYETAVENFTRVTEIDPNFAEAYNARGLAYEYLEKYEEAIADYEKALELNPEFTEAKEHLEAVQKKKREKEAGAPGEGVAAVKFMEKPKLKFDDIAGMEKVKELIKEYIVYPLQDPELARRYGKLGGGGVLLYGPPGCGKCMTGDTPVLLSTGEVRQIRDVYDEAKDKKPEIAGDGEWIIEAPDLKVLSLNKETLKIEEKRVQFAYKQRYQGKVYEIITRSGRRTTVTPEHPFIEISNGVRETKAREIVVGSFIAVPSRLTVSPARAIARSFENFVRVSTAEGGSLLYKTKRRPAKSFRPVNEITPELAEFFGYLLAEGATTYSQMFFFNSDKGLIGRVSELSQRLFNITPQVKPDRSKGVYRVDVCSIGLKKFLEHNYGFRLKGSRNTEVPHCVMTADDRTAAAFLSAVFESEANVRKDVPEIEFTTASKTFANQIAYLLLRFGIVCRIRTRLIKGNSHTYWRIYISGHGALKAFESSIGFKGDCKAGRLKRWTCRTTTGSTNVDVVPRISTLLKRAREGLGQDKSVFYGSSAKHGAQYESDKHLSKNLLARMISDKRETEEIRLLRTLGESDLLWDEVVEIREMEIDDYVYDLTIEDNHTFIAGIGGMVVHNTFIMKAAAGECKANFLNVKLSDVLDMYVGNTEKNIRNIFEAARKNAPSILFIDEIDGLGGRRDQMKESAQYMRMAVNQLLYEMDGVEARNENVLVVAATNAPWDVDPALRRAGRFTKLIYIGEPDEKMRVEVLKYHAKGRPISPAIDWWRLARATDGYANADLKAVSDDAAAIPWLEARKTGRQRNINMRDYLTAIEKKRSSLPAWYESAKKEVGKQEEIEYVDGKQYKRIKEPKMPPGERQYFRELVELIEKRNRPWWKAWSWIYNKFALYQDYVLPPLVAALGIGTYYLLKVWGMI